MIELKSTISQIENLLEEDTESSLSYAALECRLAIERICYERLRLAHDYISHDDIRKWQPRDIVRQLIQEVEPTVSETFTISISNEALPEGAPEPSLGEYQSMDFLPIGTQVGFDANKLGNLWNALAGLALHIRIPKHKNDNVGHYGDIKKVRIKVEETLREIKRLDQGTLLASGFGPEVSFECACGALNRRKIAHLADAQIISCIDQSCFESYSFLKDEAAFARSCIQVNCAKCGVRDTIPTKILENLKKNIPYSHKFSTCDESVVVMWRLMQVKAVKESEK